MSLVTRAATPVDLQRIVPQLDQQFVFGKRRQISLAQRFPAVYGPTNAGNIFVTEEDSEILSALACKRFELFDEGRIWCVAMVGAVYTHPARRGEGLASRLLQRTSEALRESGTDFAVLWTDRPAFYRRLGWMSADCGMLGETEIRYSRVEPGGEVARMPARLGDIPRIESIRQHWHACLTPRRAGDYCQLPMPADAVNLLVWGEGSRDATYALVGGTGELGILYEMIGHPDGFPVLWPEIFRSYRRLLANDAKGSASHRWLCQNTDLIWGAKPLAMWLPLSVKADVALAAHWHIPYFDRI
jgi:predicted N-acetyltransferase YhbS